MAKKYVISIQGPTAAGKTDLSIFLAEKLKTEIISADSRQFYKEMNIGTAKPAPELLDQVKHYCIGFLSVHDKFSAFDYEILALNLLKEIFINKNHCLITGGSGLYLNAIINGFDNIPDADLQFRHQLNEEFKSEGLHGILQQLKELDPVYYDQVDKKNPVRVLRALEVCISTGRPFSSFLKGERVKRDFSTIKIGITYPTEILYNRINLRCEDMIKAGLLREVKSLYAYKGLVPLKTIGYQEFFDHLDGKTEFNEAVDLFKQHTRNYAKKQLSWFRRDKEIKWFHPEEREMIWSFINNNIN
jgi:tRNA dimethylallyltransferase